MVESRSQQQGARAEQRADRYLQAQGLRTVDRNVRFRGGELDLVMLDRDELVFVEVRSRRSVDFGGAAASVDWRKQQRLRCAAHLYLMRRYGAHAWPPCRFDVVAIDGTRIDWIRGAFGSI